MRTRLRLNSSQLIVSVIATIGIFADYFLYIEHFGVNVVFWDEWNWVPLIKASFSGHLNFSMLWAQHNEDRMLFPGLLAVILGRIFSFNTFAFLYVSASLVALSALLLGVLFRNRLRHRPLLFIPALFLLMSLSQYQNTLWAFQIAWFMIPPCIYGAMLLLLRVGRRQNLTFCLAVALGVVASYSSAQGLLIWPAGLSALCICKARSRWKALWVLLGGVVAVGYFAGYQTNFTGGSGLTALPHYLSPAIEGFLTAIGSVVPGNIIRTATDPYAGYELVGMVILVVALTIVIAWLVRGRQNFELGMASTLICVGLFFDVMLVPLRLLSGPAAALQSRYSTYNLILLVGIYFGAIELAFMIGGRRRRMRLLEASIWVITAGILSSQIITSAIVGIQQGSLSHMTRTESADILVNWQQAPPELVEPYLYPPSGAYVDEYAPFLKHHKMSVFMSEKDDVRFRSEGVVPGGQQAELIPVPAALTSLLSRNKGAQDAWQILSDVYATRPDLQAEFHSTRSIGSEMIKFALSVDAGGDEFSNPFLLPDPDEYPYLAPYEKQFGRMAAQLDRDGDHTHLEKSSAVGSGNEG